MLEQASHYTCSEDREKYEYQIKVSDSEKIARVNARLATNVCWLHEDGEVCPTFTIIRLVQKRMPDRPAIDM